MRSLKYFYLLVFVLTGQTASYHSLAYLQDDKSEKIEFNYLENGDSYCDFSELILDEEDRLIEIKHPARSSHCYLTVRETGVNYRHVSGDSLHTDLNWGEFTDLSPPLS